MIEQLNAYLPQTEQQRVIAAQRFERHDEPSLQATKIHGYAADGAKCFYYHSFVLSEEGFDIDEFPLRIDVYYERVMAWRLKDGGWLKTTTVSDQLDACQPRFHTRPAEWVASL